MIFFIRKVREKFFTGNLFRFLEKLIEIILLLLNSGPNGVQYITNPHTYWKENERVAWVVEDNEPQLGKVRWIGYKDVSDRKRISPNRYWLIGIELVSFIM